MNEKKYLIIPTLFSKSVEEFNEKFNRVKELSENFHIDIMDGEFVSSKSIALEEIEFIKETNKKFGVHLMCKNPQKYFDKCSELGITNLWVHYEAIDDKSRVDKILFEIYSRGFGGGLAINPNTSLNEIEKFLINLKGVMLMSVVPGAQGQAFITDTYERVKWLRERKKDLIIQIDGGIKLDEIRELAKNGADRFCVGSFLNEVEKPIDNYILLKAAMDLGVAQREISKDI